MKAATATVKALRNPGRAIGRTGRGALGAAAILVGLGLMLWDGHVGKERIGLCVLGYVMIDGEQVADIVRAWRSGGER